MLIRNFDTIIAAKMFGPRRVRALLEHAAQYEHFDAEGTARAQNSTITLGYYTKSKANLISRVSIFRKRSPLLGRNMQLA